MKETHTFPREFSGKLIQTAFAGIWTLLDDSIFCAPVTLLFLTYLCNNFFHIFFRIAHLYVIDSSNDLKEIEIWNMLSLINKIE